MVRYLLWTLLLLVASSLLIVAFRFVVNYDSNVAASGEFLATVLGSVGQLLLPVTLLVSAITLFDVIREDADPRVALPAVLVLWTAALFGAGALFGQDVVAFAPAIPTIPEQRVVRADSASIYAGNRTANRYVPTIVHDQDGFRLYSDGAVSESSGSFIVGPEQWPLVQFSNTYASTVAPPAAFQRAVDDSSSTMAFLSLRKNGLVAVMHIAGLSLFLLGTWTLVRLTKWPLFNVAGVFLALRFALWIVPAVHDGPLRSLVVVAFSSQALPYVSAGLLGGIGIALFLTAILLPPLERFKREIAS
jgi:hypothetical protein